MMENIVLCRRANKKDDGDSPTFECFDLVDALEDEEDADFEPPSVMAVEPRDEFHKDKICGCKHFSYF